MAGRTLRSGSRPSETDMDVPNFALLLIEALRDSQVQTTLAEAYRPNEERIALLVSSRLEARFTELKTRIESQNKRIESLEKTVSELQNKHDEAEQYGRRTSIRISGLPEKENEDVSVVCLDVLKAIDLPAPSINRVHRVGPKRPDDATPRPILCQFLSYGDKAAAMKRKKHLKQRMNGVFISEDLTRKRATIHFQARQLIKKKKLQRTWTADGRILVMDNRGTIRRINNELDLKVFE